MQESDASTKGDELVEVCHVDAIEIGIANLWGTADENDFLGVETVENLDDALLECRTTDDAIVNDNKVVLVGTNHTIGDVIDVGGKVVALFLSVCDEGAQFDVFPSYLLETHVVSLTHESVEETVISHFGSVGDEGEYGV